MSFKLGLRAKDGEGYSAGDTKADGILTLKNFDSEFSWYSSLYWRLLIKELSSIITLGFTEKFEFLAIGIFLII